MRVILKSVLFLSILLSLSGLATWLCRPVFFLTFEVPLSNLDGMRNISAEKLDDGRVLTDLVPEEVFNVEGHNFYKLIKNVIRYDVYVRNGIDFILEVSEPQMSKRYNTKIVFEDENSTLVALSNQDKSIRIGRHVLINESIGSVFGKYSSIRIYPINADSFIWGAGALLTLKTPNDRQSMTLNYWSWHGFVVVLLLSFIVAINVLRFIYFSCLRIKNFVYCGWVGLKE